LLLRAVAIVAVGGLLVLTVGPFQGLESRFGLSDTAAHLAAFYIITLLAFAVAPRSRRTDLALATLGLGVLIELAQGVVGRSLSLTDLLADAVGVGAATAPAWVEQLRHLARRHPFLSFPEALAADRRLGGVRRKERPAPVGPRRPDPAASEDGWR
jgi:VanZ family protein